jgi:hypothetical protein
MNLRRIVLDVDKAVGRPNVLELAAAIEEIPGVEAANVTVDEIDIETVGMDITVEGEQIDHEALLARIEQTGAVVHSVDQACVGERLIERVVRVR